MGETLSSQKQEPIEEKLQFVQQFEDLNFGPIQIFRFKQPPYEYIMDYRKTFIQGDKRIQYYCDFIKSLHSMQHKNLTKIHFFQMKEENHMCIKDRKAHVYCNYYNFTLQQAIQKKKKYNSSFPENDLVYIMSCLASLGEYLKKQKISLGEYRADRIYISPEGYIKLYLLQLEQQNKHNSYYKALTEKSLIHQYVLAPQQLRHIANLQYELRFDIEKADVFAVGMIILQLLTLDHPKFYYQEGYSGVKIGKILFNLDTYRGNYTDRFIGILKACLSQEPSSRPTFSELNSELEQLKKTMQSLSYCIRLQDEQQGSNKRKIIQKLGKKDPLVPSFLSGPNKRLAPSPITTFSTNKTPSPITTLTSTSSSHFKGNNSSSKYNSQRQSANIDDISSLRGQNDHLISTTSHIPSYLRSNR